MPHLLWPARTSLPHSSLLTWSCLLKKFRNCRLALLVLLGTALKKSKSRLKTSKSQFWFDPLPHLLWHARASLPHSSLLSCLVMYPQRIRNCRLALLALLCPALKALKPFKPQQASFGPIRPTPCLTFFGLLGLPCLTPAFQAAWSCLSKKFQSFGSKPSPCLTFFGVPGPRCLTLAFSAGWSCLFKKLRNCCLALLVLLGPALKIFKSLETFKKPVLVLLRTALTSPSLACSAVLASLQPSKVPDHLS